MLRRIGGKVYATGMCHSISEPLNPRYTNTEELGQGANQAIESAAALTSSLHELLQSTSGTKPSLDALRKALKQYQDSRLGRAHGIGDLSRLATRMQEGTTFKDRLLDRLLPVLMDDFFASK